MTAYLASAKIHIVTFKSVTKRQFLRTGPPLCGNKQRKLWYYIMHRSTFILRFFSAVLSIVILFTVGCQGSSKDPYWKENPVSKQAFLLNTIVTITLYDSDDASIIDDAFTECRRYENIFSRTIASSEISLLNNRPAGESTFTVSDDVQALLEKGLYYSSISSGAFDITVEPLTSLWDFTASTPVLPDPAAIESALPAVDYTKVSLEGNELSFASPDTKLDLGAIAKGYIADRLKVYLKGRGINSALINLGGNVLCIGSKPDSSPFKIGVQKPFENRNETIATMNINDLSVVSSGVYERHFILEGTNYHHLLDPKTGYPFSNGLISVTIISQDSVDGDGLSTTCFALGLEQGLALVNSLDGIYGIFITDDYELHYSDGAESFITK